MKQRDKTFGTWLNKQMQKRGWSRADLTTQTISLHRPSKALDIPAQEIYGEVVELPHDPASDAWVKRMAHKVSLVPPSLRYLAERLIDALIEGEKPTR